MVWLVLCIRLDIPDLLCHEFEFFLFKAPYILVYKPDPSYRHINSELWFVVVGGVPDGGGAARAGGGRERGRGLAAAGGGARGAQLRRAGAAAAALRQRLRPQGRLPLPARAQRQRLAAEQHAVSQTTICYSSMFLFRVFAKTKMVPSPPLERYR